MWLLLRFAGLVVVVVTVLRGDPGQSATTTAVLWAAVVVAVVACACWTFGPLRGVRWSLAAMLVAFGVMIALVPDSAASVMGGTIAYSAGFDLHVRDSGRIVAAGSSGLVLAALFLHSSPGRLLLVLVFALMWWAGLSHQQYVVRAEQAERLLAEGKRAAEASATAAALAERARIAREIHDILAHSLAALAIQLEAVDATLATHPDAETDPVLRAAALRLARSLRLTRDGLVETRRAVHALREDAVPLPELVEALAGTYRDEGEQPVRISVVGEPFPLSAQAGLTTYRVVQEALTNARKHAPESEVAVEVRYGDTEVEVSITTALPGSGADRPLTGTGAGLGLIGLHERAELAGGRMSSGPVGGNWCVSVVIPA
ncbi:putative two-component system sensor kinase [Actinokineospora spheciospongiae]|uniref:histidine kinase n=1 Tax=Actinokineospora spheciospongiae TaxID=909613 RepID=W7IM98_9PSEU|nr:putative two-component system sensor kinase [Actinokineospora spheciospongiae]